MLRDLAEARLLLVSDRQECVEAVEGALKVIQIQSQVVATVSDAASKLIEAARVAKPLSLVMVDAKLAFAAMGEHRAADLCEKARIARVPVYLLGDIPSSVTVQQHGYVGVLAITAEAMAQAVRASPQWLNAIKSNRVVRVEPWVWQQRESESARRILIVDDNQTNLLIVQSILNAAGYEVDALDNAKDALNRLLAGDYRLAILDLHMPDMDGATLLRQYQRMRPKRKIPIVFLTANTTMDATRECADAGADAFLTKPVQRTKLLDTLETLLKHQEIYRLSAAEPQKNNTVSKSASLPLLELDTVREVFSLYDANPAQRMVLIKQFRAEAEQLLIKLEKAVTGHDYAAYADLVRALHASAVNFGATALAMACQNAAAVDIVEFRRLDVKRLGQLHELFQATIGVLEEVLEKTA